MSNKKITGKELILKVLKSAKKPLSVKDIWDEAKKKGYAEEYAPGYVQEDTEKQKKTQISADILRMSQEENSTLERFSKGEKGKDITYSLCERIQSPPIKIESEERNEKMTGKELIILVLENANKPLSVLEIWDIAEKKGYAKLYGKGNDAKQKRTQIAADIYRWYHEENSPLERFEKGVEGKDITYSLCERIQLPSRKGDHEEDTGKNDEKRMVSSGYCKRISYKNWLDKCKAKTPEGNDDFSIVYRVYSVSNGDIRYVGRSDRPFARINSHIQQIICNGVINNIGCRIFEVDFKCFTGKNRFEEAYKEECRIFHDREPKKNTNHPARNKGESWECPKSYCEYSTS